MERNSRFLQKLNGVASPTWKDCVINKIVPTYWTIAYEINVCRSAVGGTGMVGGEIIKYDSRASLGKYSLVNTRMATHRAIFSVAEMVPNPEGADPRRGRRSLSGTLPTRLQLYYYSNNLHFKSSLIGTRLHPQRATAMPQLPTNLNFPLEPIL